MKDFSFNSSAAASLRKAPVVVSSRSFPAWIDAGERGVDPLPLVTSRVRAGLVLRSILRHPPTGAKASPHVLHAR
jgi:hypothetical protein